MDWKQEFVERGAFWQYQEGDDYHVKSSKDIHTDLFLNTDYLVCDPGLINEIIANDFLPALHQRHLAPDWVVTYPPYGMPVAYALASAAKSQFAYMSSRGEKENFFNIKKGDSILIATDDVYSGGSIRNIIDYFGTKNIQILDTLLCLGNFSNSDSIGGLAIHSTIKDTPQFWAPNECPLCQVGSTAVYHRSQWNKLISRPGKPI